MNYKHDLFSIFYTQAICTTFQRTTALQPSGTIKKQQHHQELSFKNAWLPATCKLKMVSIKIEYIT